jgi:magnesium-transporting ATPase (P-type)
VVVVTLFDILQEGIPSALIGQSLTSSEANQRLVSDVGECLDNIRLFAWPKIIINQLPRIINTFYLTCILILIVTVIISTHSSDVVTINNSYPLILGEIVIIIIILIVNISLLIIENKVQIFWHKKRCMSKLADFLNSNHSGWTHQSYPSEPLFTLRSQVTVKGIRDKKLVNIPQAILVSGDIIQLNLRLPAPADVRIIKMQSNCTGGAPEELKVGQVAFDDSVLKEKKSVEFMKQSLCWYKVTRTPFPMFIYSTGLDSSKMPLICQQKLLIEKVINYAVIPVFFILPVLVNLIRWFIFGRDYFDTIDLFVNWPILVVLPLVSLSLHALWFIVNAYGVSSLDHSLYENDNKRTCLQALLNTVKAVLMPYKYSKIEVLHSFGNVTAICAVDKEYILTGSFPTPEKLFFFKSNTSSTTADKDNLSAQESHDSPSIEVFTEILDITPTVSKTSGMAFDDPNWEVHLNSLKAIGLNLIITSHFFTNTTSSNLFSYMPSESLHYSLGKTQCCCSLASEIGVSKFPTKHLQCMNSVFVQSKERPNSSSGSLSVFQNDWTQSHLLAIICHNQLENSNILLSRGSGDIIAQCCSDLWDGQDLQPMTDAERSMIIDFFARRNLSSYCIALAYNPIFNLSHHGSVASLVSSAASIDNNLFSIKCGINSQSQLTLADLSNQVFVGMVSLQYYPKSDVVALVQELRDSGIRFIYFTSENEVRGRIFAEKLGLEAGWNCHISLSPDSPDDVVNEADDEDHSENRDEFNVYDSISSASSSLTSIYNVNQAYIKAQLPKGVDKIRAHLKNVDNVPLLVPLFTDCTPEAVKEMMTIMQENGEIVLCMGSAWIVDNMPLFKQAEIGLSLIPANSDRTESDCSMLPTISEDNDILPMHVAATLSSLTSEIQIKRDENISLHNVIIQARHLQGSIQKSMLFALGSSLFISCVILMSTLLFLPPSLSRSHEFWLLLLVIPLLSLSLLSVRLDENTSGFMPDRAMSIHTGDFYMMIVYFAFTYLPCGFICLIIFWITLNGLCLSDNDFHCNPILGNVNVSSLNNTHNQSLGWTHDNHQGLVLAQDLTALFVTIYIAISCLMFLNRAKPIWRLYRYINWPIIVGCVTVVFLHVVYFIMSQLITVSSVMKYWSVTDIPFYSWLVGIGWIPLQLILQELVKLHMKKKFVHAQRKLRLSFQTKLGMNSPF